MLEQITWTHVDKMVRKMLEDKGQIACGSTDAEVTYDCIRSLRRQLRILEVQKEQVETKLAWTETQLRAAQDNPVKKSKTKERLAKLECQVSRLIALAKEE